MENGRIAKPLSFRRGARTLPVPLSHPNRAACTTCFPTERTKLGPQGRRIKLPDPAQRTPAGWRAAPFPWDGSEVRPFRRAPVPHPPCPRAGRSDSRTCHRSKTAPPSCRKTTLKPHGPPPLWPGRKGPSREPLLPGSPGVSFPPHPTHIRPGDRTPGRSRPLRRMQKKHCPAEPFALPPGAAKPAGPPGVRTFRCSPGSSVGARIRTAAAFAALRKPMHHERPRTAA